MTTSPPEPSTGDDYIFEQLVELETTIETVLDRIESIEARQDRFADRLAEVEQRTNLLAQIGEEPSDGEARSAALLQHCKQAAENNGGSYAIHHSDVEDVLHYPDVHRTTLYSDMKRVARWVDGDLCDYEGGRLRLRLPEDDDLCGRLNTDAEVL